RSSRIGGDGRGRNGDHDRGGRGRQRDLRRDGCPHPRSAVHARAREGGARAASGESNRAGSVGGGLWNPPSLEDSMRKFAFVGALLLVSAGVFAQQSVSPEQLRTPPPREPAWAFPVQQSSLP